MPPLASPTLPKPRAAPTAAPPAPTAPSAPKGASTAQPKASHAISPECSKAVSAWNLLRAGKPTDMPAHEIYVQLGKCRSMAHGGNGQATVKSESLTDVSARNLQRAHAHAEAIKAKHGETSAEYQVAKRKAKEIERVHHELGKLEAAHKATKARIDALKPHWKPEGKPSPKGTPNAQPHGKPLDEASVADHPSVKASKEAFDKRLAEYKAAIQQVRSTDRTANDGKDWQQAAVKARHAEQATYAAAQHHENTVKAAIQETEGRFSREVNRAGGDGAEAKRRFTAAQALKAERRKGGNVAETTADLSPEEAAKVHSYVNARLQAHSDRRQALREARQKPLSSPLSDAHAASGPATQAAAKSARRARQRPQNEAARPDRKPEPKPAPNAPHDLSSGLDAGPAAKDAKAKADEARVKASPKFRGVNKPGPARRGQSFQTAKIVPTSRTVAAKAKADEVRANAPERPREQGPPKPGTVGTLKQADIAVDPKRFQYKQGAGSTTGSVGSLKGVKKWDAQRAGVIQVWHDPSDGKHYVVNGHNRLSLARDLGVEDINVMHIGAKDWKEARKVGALTNIAEGRGTSLDAADFMRHTDPPITSQADFEKYDLPIKEKVATEGVALAAAAEPLWKRAESGDIPAHKAAIIGGSGLSHERQMELVKEYDKYGGKVSPETLERWVSVARTVGTSAKQGGLFGDEESVSDFHHHVALDTHVEDVLRSYKGTFGVASDRKRAALLSKYGSDIDIEEADKQKREAAENLAIYKGLKESTAFGKLRRTHAARLMDAKSNAEKAKIKDDYFNAVIDKIKNGIGF